MRHLLVLTLALSFVTTTGCKRIAKSLGGRTQTTRAADGEGWGKTSPEQQDKAEEKALDALGEKLNFYVDCVNKVSSGSGRGPGSMRASERRYFEWVDVKKGPTGKESGVGFFPLGDTNKCTAGLEKAKTQKPALPKLEAAGDAYAAALTKAAPLMKDADEYYAQRTYQEDKFAKGKALHPQLVAAFDEFDKADMAMREELDSNSRQSKERRLALLEKTDGRKIPYLRTALMLIANDIVDMGNVDNELAKIDAAKFKAKLDELQKTVKELAGYMGAHRDEVDALRADWLNGGETWDFVKATEEMARRLGKDKPFDAGEKDSIDSGRGNRVDGTSEKLLEKYNRLIDRGNR